MMTDDNVVAINRLVEQMRREMDSQAEQLKTGGGGGTSGFMDGRVTRLEVTMEFVRKDLDAISGKLDTLIDRTSDLPTKRDLWAWKWQWTALGFAVIAIIIGGIIGGLSWIRPDASAPPPVNVTVTTPEGWPGTVVEPTKP